MAVDLTVISQIKTVSKCLPVCITNSGSRPYSDVSAMKRMSKRNGYCFSFGVRKMIVHLTAITNFITVSTLLRKWRRMK